MVILDSNHAKAHVPAELEVYAALVSPQRTHRRNEAGYFCGFGRKVYSLHAPEVECIGKGKEHAPGRIWANGPDAEAFDVPVAFIVYNRPEFTRQLIAALRLVCPRHVLVVADAPNPSRAGDDIRCQQVSAAVSEIDCSCEIEVNVADNHLGCRKRPQTGLNWIFERVQQAIILEDDCIPDQIFFRFVANRNYKLHPPAR
jgi:hypothetical protein